MEITNLRNVDRKGTNILNFKYNALIDITTGFWFWKKVETKEICKSDYLSSWFFKDTGKFTPGFEVENLIRSYEAKTGDYLDGKE